VLIVRFREKGDDFWPYGRQTGSNPATDSHTSLSLFPENGDFGNLPGPLARFRQKPDFQGAWRAAKRSTHLI
jgi:hypothetical protein